MYNNRFAIIVSSTATDSNSDLTSNDVAGLKSIFENNKIGSFKIQDILINKTKSYVEDRLEIFFRDRNTTDTLLVYFLCHGVVSDSSIFLLMNKHSSNHKKNIKTHSIDLSFLKNLMHTCASERQFLILDCCLKSIRGFNANMNSMSIEELLEPDKTGRVILTSCDLDQGAGIDQCNAEQTHNSNFTRHFVNGIYSGDADLDDDGVITISEIYNYAHMKVLSECNYQNPRIFGQSRDICIAKNQNYIKKGRKTINIEKLRHPISQKQMGLVARELARKYKSCQLKRIKITNEDSYEELGIEGAHYLDEKITHNDKIALSCGRTLLEALVHMKRKSLSEITIYPLSVHPSINILSVDSNILTALCMAKLSIADSDTNATAYKLPLFAEDDGSISISSKNKTMNILYDASKSDIFLLGIGNPLSPHANISKFFDQAGISNSDLKSMGARGEILYHLYDENGQFLINKEFENENERFGKILKRYYDQFITLDLEYLYKIRDSPGVDIIAIAGGKEKRFSILGAIRAGLIRTLITDDDTAIWLLKQQPGPFKRVGELSPLSLKYERIGGNTAFEPLVCPHCDYRSRIQSKCPLHNVDLIPLEKKGGK